MNLEHSLKKGQRVRTVIPVPVMGHPHFEGEATIDALSFSRGVGSTEMYSLILDNGLHAFVSRDEIELIPGKPESA